MTLEISELLLPAIVIQILQSIKELVCHTFNNKKWKNLQNTAYPEIVFCYIARIFAYFILSHIVLYFTFRCGFLVTIVLHRAHKDAHLFCFYFFPVTYTTTYFILTHQLIIIFNFATKKLCTFILPHIP